ncbi:hypothetical protein ABVT39_019803 [Epinephelus coioides]
MQTLWSSQPAVMRPLDVHTVLVPEAPHTQTVQVQQPNTQTAATVHVPVHHLPQLCEVSPAFTLVSPETASMSLASPAAPTKEEQAKYFRQAETERVLHAQRHPEWSPSDNFLLHLNVMRAHSRAIVPSWSSQQAVMRPLDVHTVLVPEALHTQTVQVQQPNTQTAATVHVPVHHLPQLCEVSPAFTLVSPETASMSLASPAAPTKEEQAKYFRQAETERVLHAQRHPEWSSSDNFVSPTCSHTTHTSIHTE